MDEILKVLIEIKNLITETSLGFKEVFTLQEFCNYCGISLDQGYKITSANKIKFYRPGKMIYIDREEALTYLKSNPVNSMKATEVLANRALVPSKQKL